MVRKASGAWRTKRKDAPPPVKNPVIMHIWLGELTTLAVIGGLQIALRCPKIPADVAGICRRLIEVLAAQMPPKLQGEIRRGYDPANDVPAEE